MDGRRDRDFERWITNNPKPTRQQKLDFANQHDLLQVSHVQNKINNWRNGRNLQRHHIEISKKDDGNISEDQVKIIDRCMDACAVSNVDREFGRSDFGNPAGSETFSTLASADKRTLQESLSSSVSSIMRYMSCAELEADPEDIEKAFQRSLTASLEDPLDAPRSSTCMRVPSLRAVNSLDRNQSFMQLDDDEILPVPDSFSQQQLPGREENEYNTSKNQDRLEPSMLTSPWAAWKSLLANQEVPEPDSQHSPHGKHEWVLEEADNRWSVGDERLLSTSRGNPEVVETTFPSIIEWLRNEPLGNSGNEIPRSRSRAESVISATTSHSATFTQSARYSIKYKRRLSANNRRHSADSRVDLSSRRRGHQQQQQFPTTTPEVLISQPSQTSLPRTRNSSSPARADGRADYFGCPFPDCAEIFSSLPSLKAYEESSHFESYCTFCKKSFRNPQYWRVHEQKHLRERDGLFYSNHMLWYCGICSIRGLSEARRYIHIRQHWKQGHKSADWLGKPRVIPLTAEENEKLLDMPEDFFQAAARVLLSAPKSRRPTIVGLKSFFDHERHSEKPFVLPSTDLVGKPTILAPSQPREAEDAPRPMVCGLFASIRKKFFRTKTKPP